MANCAGFRVSLIAAALVSSTALLSGCGKDGSSSAGSAASGSSAATSTASNSAALSLSGTPSTTVAVGTAYSFTPTVTGSTTTVGFTVQNKPAWAEFNTATGTFTGTPSAAHVGTYANIVISATSGSGASAALAAFSLTVTQAGTTSRSATLSWTAPTQNTDGSAISDLAGYRIYYGSSTGALTSSVNLTNPALTSYTVANLGTGTTYFGITAYTTGGVESGISNIGSKTVM